MKIADLINEPFPFKIETNTDALRVCRDAHDLIRYVRDFGNVDCTIGYTPTHINVLVPAYANARKAYCEAKAKDIAKYGD